MNNIFDKLGIYDVMGIWGTGAICTVYYLQTLIMLCKEEISSKLVPISQNIFFLAIIAYVVGAILHELGKWIFGMFGKTFEVEKLSKITNGGCCFKCGSNKLFVKIFLPSLHIKSVFCERAEHIKSKNISLNNVLALLKNKNKLYLIDKYHSIYGLSRGLCIQFVIHALLFMGVSTDMVLFKNIVIFVDIFMGILFGHRAYRYYLYWIVSAYEQFDLIKREQLNEKIRHNHRKTNCKYTSLHSR